MQTVQKICNTFFSHPPRRNAAADHACKTRVGCAGTKYRETSAVAVCVPRYIRMIAQKTYIFHFWWCTFLLFSMIFVLFQHFSGVRDSPTPHSNNDPGPHYAHSTGARRATHLPGLAATATRGAGDPELFGDFRGVIGGSAITTPHTREGELAEPQRHIFLCFFLIIMTFPQHNYCGSSL